jgi:hypothetical protein
MADQSRLTWALIVSVLLHGLLLSLLPILRRAHLEIPTPPALLDVDVLPLPKPQAAPPPPIAAVPAAPAPPQPPVVVPKQQIVSPPDQGEEKEPENARFLSDKNNTVKEETIHRGEPVAGSPESKHEAPPKLEANAKTEHKPAAPKAQAEAAEHTRPNTQMASLPKLDQLLPPAGDLIREGLVQPQEPAASAPAAAPEQHAAVERNDLLRHGDPWKTSSGRGGSMDFLPQVREGDVTMLNTKAEQFAPFVRRVAVRVFEDFRILLRRSIDSRRADSTEEFATIEAVMDKQGRLLSITAKDRSMSVAFATDRNLQAACQEGFFDRNPPPGAESNDGNIHFIFDAHVGVLVDPGRGVAGYRALFQAGLL